MTWRPTGDTMRLHLAMQRTRLNDAGWRRREFFAKSAGLDPEECIFHMRNLVRYGWAEGRRRSTRKGEDRTQWREYRGKPPSELPAHGVFCDTCGGLLGERLTVCEQCLPDEINRARGFGPGGEMKIRLLAERYAQGQPLWQEEDGIARHEVQV